MKRCRKCGREFDDTSKDCLYCALPLVDSYDYSQGEYPEENKSGGSSAGNLMKFIGIALALGALLFILYKITWHK